MKTFRLLLLSALPLFTLSACPAKPPACDATTCSGCCDSAGQCANGIATDNCGTGGQLCTSCFAGQVCTLGLCRSNGNTGGGSGGGSGGGAGGGAGGGTTGPLMCAAGKTACSSVCVDTRTDVRNCGMCGSLCNPNQFCGNGMCTLLPANCAGGCPNGYFCTSGNECKPGCSTNADCPQPGSCDTRLNLCSCLSGFHGCGQTCAADNNVSACGTACASCDGIPNAVAACTASRCDFTCNPGLHRCGGACKSDTDVATCGTSCTPCAPPPNSVATCSGLACDFVCNTGFHKCGTQCVSNTSVNSCGSNSCTPCAPPANAVATCNGFSCDFTCNSGFHRCGSVCVSNTSINSCGSSCSACVPPASATATCDGFSCGFSCNTGSHGCAGACVSNLNVSSCGTTSCTPCSAPFNGTSTCNGVACDFVCNGGSHRCGSVCSDNTSVAACGTSCNPCPAGPANSVRTCDGFTCGWTCSAGYHNCGGACVADTSTTQCGASCLSCPPVTNALPACVGGACDFTCTSGFHKCGSQCLSNTDVNSCGSSCTACPTGPAGSTPNCNGTTCGFTCAAGANFCNGECVPPDFANACGSSCTNCTATGTFDRGICASGSCGTACITSCNSACVDVTRDPANCGNCGTTCTGTQTCTAGECRATCTTGPAFEGALPYVNVSANGVYKLVTEDLNADGHVDIVDNGSIAGLHVRYSNADGTFQAPVLLSLTSVRASGFVVVDLNGDGKKDIVATRTGVTSSQIAVFLNNGTSFSAASLLSMSTYVPTGVILVGDFNADTKVDFVIPATSTYLFYYFQSATAGVFPTTYSAYSQNTLAGATFGEVADFNKDGRPDFVLATSTQWQVSLHSGTSMATSPHTAMTPQTTSAVFPAFVSLKTADLDNDTNPDFLLRSAGNAISVLGTGTGTFGAPTTFAFGGSSPILPVDLNADGLLDLVSGGSSIVYLSAATTAGVWPAPVSRLLNAPGTNQMAISTGQLVGTAAPEIFTAPQSASTVQVSILVNEGTGFFPGVRNSGTTSTNVTGVAGDIDGDGDRDLIVSGSIALNATGTGNVLLGNNTGNFGSSVGTVTLRGDEMAIGRLNGDAFADLVATIESSTLQGVDVFLATGGGAFAAPVRLATTGLPAKVVIANLDSDALADIVVGTASGVEWFKGNGDGTFAAAQIVGTGQTVQALAVADLNLDGKADLLVNSGTGSLRVYLGYGGGTFPLSPFVQYTTSSTVTDVQSVDFDRDGRLDVAVAASTGVLLYKGNGAGVLTQQTTQSTMLGRLSVVDLDNDGLFDLLTNNAGEVQVARGLATAFTFAPKVNYVPGRTLSPAVVLVDKFNNDTFRDVLVLATNTEVWTYLGICR